MENKIRKIIVHGNNWGLACNYIHFIDLINFFNNEKNTKLSVTNFQIFIIQKGMVLLTFMDV